MGPGHLKRLLQPKMAEIRRYLIRLGADPADAEDIVQDAVYKALLYIEAIDERKFSAWLYKAAINRYYDVCRRQKRFQLAGESADPAIPEHELPEETLLRRERKDLVERVLGQLNPVHRQLILMKYEMELSYKEIATLLDISEGKVKASLYRARRQFQHYYGGEDQ
ncbi:RNA polymerase sigma-70 factor (ECF subfamily) [Paenibacillus forsythiae]|uniref:RNA polymerase sigma-70 factor (ECF subfamily) n=1 Tax=Paenibacillus forsythiae TaxID=365616 RepID=A0ABU3H8H3_9BACL|nr:RNA polymerase sigma factor [Paenibacillus forsythiae]MDT3425970.1 RNA polymerase sigma-70 factor (ECF subfamily) [Paenibacillus forsythiae]